MKRFVFCLFIVSSFMMVSCSSDDFLDSENNAKAKTTFYSNANEAYDALLNAFDSGTRGVAKSYPDYYGGAYVENGKLILLTPFEDLKDNDYESLLGKASYEVRKCKYSYNELVAVKNTILDYVVKCRGAVSSNIQSCSISGFENKVVVYLYDCLDGSIALFRNEVIDSDVIEFRQAGGEIVEASYPMVPGTEIQVNEGEGSGGSVGYRAKYTKYGKTVYGFVTCAHVVNAGATVKYNGSNVGVSDKDRWVHSGLDATFCSFSSDRYELSNLIGATGKNLSVATGFVAAETSVSKYGRTTFESTGIVKSESTFYTVNGVDFTDVVRVENMDADYGDSGGIVYDSSNKTLGIVSAIEMKSGKPTGVVWYMKAPNINIKFGIERY